MRAKIIILEILPIKRSYKWFKHIRKKETYNFPYIFNGTERVIFSKDIEINDRTRKKTRTVKKKIVPNLDFFIMVEIEE